MQAGKDGRGWYELMNYDQLIRRMKFIITLEATGLQALQGSCECDVIDDEMAPLTCDLLNQGKRLSFRSGTRNLLQIKNMISRY